MRICPRGSTTGVFMARRDNVWVQSVIESSRRYRDDLWSYNSAIVTYRMYELHPKHVLVDRRLQVICHADRTCCPRWLNATHCAITNQRTAATAGQSQPPHWRDGVLSYHVVLVKPHPSLDSPDTVKKRTDMFAELARTILVKSGRQHLLK
ncbi:uncharacterized protein [Littorina saxatilis]|uniref:uncharacterized protein n=1 Tax=Littorina saxatilis TaxID=31220 RepID=UPI0038B5E556